MYQLDDLLYLMARLRNPQTGCPWDLKQDFASIVPHTLEEAYEVADAIERQDWPHVEEELGDLLFQVIFYGQIAVEREYFSVASIIDKLVRKLVRRHPHVFPGSDLHAERDPAISAEIAQAEIEKVNANWDAIKAEEKREKAQRYSSLNRAQNLDPAMLEDNTLLGSVPVTLPALPRAQKLGKKASSVGFDWPDSQGALDKIREELAEVEHELAQAEKLGGVGKNRQRLSEEIGDLLFAVTNLARHVKVDCEQALRGTNARFQQRFAAVEALANERGGFDQLTLEEMDAAWVKAKQAAKEQAK